MELVVGASDAAMKALLGKLGGLLAQEYTLIRGVRGEIQYINDELASMQAFLRNLNRDDDHDEQMKDWMKQVRDVAYDIEDCIDDFNHRLGREPRGDDWIAAIHKFLYEHWTMLERRDIASKIGDLKRRAQHVGERRTRYGVSNPDGAAAAAGGGGGGGGSAPSYLATDRPLPPPQLGGMKEPVGMDHDIGKMRRLLASSEQSELRVLAIVGFGGLGKTTLAMELHRRFGAQFQSRASVYASQKFKLAALLRGLLAQVKPQGYEQQDGRPKGSEQKQAKPQGSEQQGGTSQSTLKGTEGWEVTQLKQELQKHLNEKRYFILIDDIWSVSAWHSIRESLPENQEGSRIVVTTRFKSVAEACCLQHVNHVHLLERLNREKAEKLFVERVFGPNDTCPNRLKVVQRRILKKCAGLPLAIVTIAGLLASKPRTEKQWMKVCNSLNSDLEKDTPEGLTQVLNLCYNDLHADLKTCLLYLSIFPKGCNISRKRLIRRWIAEGFISEKHGLTIEEVGEHYFHELISRNIIRPVDHSNSGKVKSCQVHDMILEYIVSKSSEENFITVIGGHWLTPMPSNKVRRLSLHPDHAKREIERMSLAHVRSLTIFGSLDQLPSSSFKFAILQVLDLEGCKRLQSNHFKNICEMFQLKYLSLRKTSLSKIPPEIEKLRYLETLDIRETNVQELPATVVHLEQMTYLLGGNKTTRLALNLTGGTGKMRALRTLSGIEIRTTSGAFVADMLHLIRLKKLSIYNMIGSGDNAQIWNDLLSAIEYLSSYSLQFLAIDDGFIGIFDKLDSLSSPPRFLRTFELSGKLSKPPKWIDKLENLEKLTLSLTALSSKALDDLSRLPALFSLTFSFNAAQRGPSVLKILDNYILESGRDIFVPAGGFAKLKLLRFSSPVLPLLSFLEGAMPNLERLELRFRTLEGLYGTENIENLQEVHLRTSDRASNTANEMVSAVERLVRAHPKKPRVTVDKYYD